MRVFIPEMRKEQKYLNKRTSTTLPESLERMGLISQIASGELPPEAIAQLERNPQDPPLKGKRSTS